MSGTVGDWSKAKFIDRLNDQLLEAKEYEDDPQEAVFSLLDNEVTYYSDSVDIVGSLGYFGGYDQSEFYPFKDISQLAYAALYTYLYEDGGINEISEEAYQYLNTY